MATVEDVLSGVPLFHNLGGDALKRIAARFREDRFDIDETIFREGDPASRFWIVKEGQVKILRISSAGRQVVIEVIPPGQMFGGAAMLFAEQPATAQALTEAATLSVPVEEYKQILFDYPTIAIRIIRALGARMHGVIQVRTMAGERVERRIAHILCNLVSKAGKEVEDGMMISISLSRQDIAELADTTLETAIRTMSRFSKEGLIRTLSGGYIVVTNHEGLLELSQGYVLPGGSGNDISLNS